MAFQEVGQLPTPSQSPSTQELRAKIALGHGVAGEKQERMINRRWKHSNIKC